jgi:DNA polymerase III subunit alpha
MPQSKPFVHLHFHTSYSLLDGLCQVGATMDRALELGQTAVAISDHGVMYGVMDFYKTAKAKGVKPLIGCEAYMAYGSMHEKQKVAGQKGQTFHQLLLAETEEGYRNLTHLITRAHQEGFYYKPRIDRELLAKHAKGLIATSTCFKGEIPQRILAGDMEGAFQLAGLYQEIMGKENFFLELQDHGIPEQRTILQGLIEIHRRTGIPLVATNDVHYLRKEHAEAHEVMLCLQTSTVMSDPKRMRYTSNEFYMKSGDEMWALFKDYPESLTNTVAIAERCNVEFKLGKDLHFPRYDVPDKRSPKDYLTELIHIGLKERYGMEDPDQPANEKEEVIKKRYLHELSVIETTGFINYFLVVWDFINYAKEHKIPVGPGRGSGAGSLVAYALGITGIDPLQYNLIFERFLNPERVSPPDFDIDFCQSRREEVIEYVKDKYGRDTVAQIITFGTLGAKTVLRDLGRALEIPFSYCDRLAKMVPEDPKMTLDIALKTNAEFKQATETEEHAKLIMQYARVLEGNPRNPGTHAAGVILGDEPLVNLVPLSLDKDGQVVTQYEMKPLEEIGLLKLDFLGLKTLTVIQEAVDHVKDRHGVELDMMSLPMDDEKTFGLLNRGDTVAVFQVESKGMRELLRRIGLSRFEDLIAMIALYRPGPMNMLDDFVARKLGKVDIVYDHPLLEPILKETYGVMLYQEQVQFAANVLAGFSLGQGDVLRRAMGKKQKEEMISQRQAFVDGCRKTNQISAKVAEKIFDNIEHFAGYGFNKSHSAAYAILSYQTAYLKAHYPAEFMAAVCSCDMNNADKLPIFIAEAQEMKLAIYPPNVNESHVRFTPEKDGIRFGMAGIKNVGVAAVEAIIRERKVRGPFSGLVDFCARMGTHNVNKKVIESLVKCGAFDFTGLSRAQLFNGIDFAVQRAASDLKDQLAGQSSLFDALDIPENGDAAPEADELPAAEPWSNSVMLAAEKELLGFYISGHPLTEYEWEMERFSMNSFDDLVEMPSGAVTRIGGLVSQLNKRYTKKTQEAFASFQLETIEGSLEVVAFPATYREFGLFLEENAPIFVCGELESNEQLKIKASEIYPVREIHRHFTQRVSIHLSAVQVSEDLLASIKSVLQRHPGDTPIDLCLMFADGKKIFISTDRLYRVNPRPELVDELEALLGEQSIYLDLLKTPCKRPQTRNGGRQWGRRQTVNA